MLLVHESGSLDEDEKILCQSKKRCQKRARLFPVNESTSSLKVAVTILEKTKKQDTKEAKEAVSFSQESTSIPTHWS